MKQLLLTVKDKTKLNELEKLGYIVYVSDYTNIVGFECPDEHVALLSHHPNIAEINEACTGSLFQ